MYGDEYISQYIISEFRKQSRQETYEYYVTECLKIITENSSKYAGGVYMTRSYSDIVDDKQSNKEKEESAEEIKTRLKNKMKIDFGGKEE